MPPSVPRSCIVPLLYEESVAVSQQLAHDLAAVVDSGGGGDIPQVGDQVAGLATRQSAEAARQQGPLLASLLLKVRESST